MRRIQKLMVVLIVLMINLSACSQINTPVNNEPETGLDHGTVKIIQEDGGPSQGGIVNLFMTTPDTLNPLTTKNETVCQMASFVFDALFLDSPDGQLKKGLIDSYTISNDGMIVDLVLKDNILFHDGQTLSADDVAFSVETIQKVGSRSLYYDYVKSVDSVKLLTRLSCRLVLNKEDPEILNKLTFPIIPRHVFEDWPIEGYSDALKLIGTGPFIFKSYEENTISLIRNDSWYYVNASDGLGHPIWLDGINFKIYPDESYMMEAFQKKEIDVAFNDVVYMEGFSQRTDLYFRQYESNVLEFLAISPTGKDNSPVSQEAFRSILIDYLWGYEGLIDSDAGKLIIPIEANEMGSSRADTLKALSEAGFTYDQEKNVLTYQKNGIKIPVVLSLRYNSFNDERKSVSQKITNALFEIGITVNAETANQAELQALAGNGRFDMMLLGCRIPYYTDVSGALALVGETLGMGEQSFTLMPLYRKYSAVLYQKTLRGSREPSWKNIYSGWTEWYLVQNQ